MHVLLLEYKIALVGKNQQFYSCLWIIFLPHQIRGLRVFQNTSWDWNRFWRQGLIVTHRAIAKPHFPSRSKHPESAWLLSPGWGQTRQIFFHFLFLPSYFKRKLEIRPREGYHIWLGPCLVLTYLADMIN